MNDMLIHCREPEVSNDLFFDAICNNDTTLVDLVIAKHPELLQQRNCHSRTCLEYAIDCNQFDLVRKLVFVCPDLILCKAVGFQTALEQYVFVDNLLAVQIMLTRLPSAASTLDAVGKSLLHTSLSRYEPNEKMVAYILSCIPSNLVALQDMDGDTALHLAVHKNMLQIVKALYAIDPRAARMQTKWTKKNPFYVALDHGWEDIVDFFLSVDVTLIDTLQDSKQNVLFSNANATIMQKLLHLRPHLIRSTDTFNDTPLHRAVGWNPSCVSCFIAADPNLIFARNANEETPLEIAFAKKLSSLVNILLQHVPDSQVIDSKGNTTLHMALVCCPVDTLRRVFEHNKQFLNTKNNNAKTPFQVAAQAQDMAALALFQPHATIEMVAEIRYWDVYPDFCLFMRAQLEHVDKQLLPELTKIVDDYLDL